MLKKTMKILFLDHHDAFQQEIIGFLKEHNLEVFVAGTLDGVAQSFERNKPDFLVLNYGSAELQTPQWYQKISHLLQVNYNPVLLLAEEREIKQHAKEIKLEQVYWFSKSRPKGDMLSWFEKQKTLRDRYSETFLSDKCLQDACGISNSIVDSLPSALVVLDGQMRITHHNQGFRSLFRVGDSAIQNRHVCDLIHNKSGIHAQDNHVAACPFVQAIDALSVSEGNKTGQEVKLTDESGAVTFYTIMTSRLPLINYRLLVDIRDITERKKYEEDIALRDRLASIGGLSIGIAHEINNPNGAIRIGIKNISAILTVITPLIHEVNKGNQELQCGSLPVGAAIEKLPHLCDCVLNATERIASVVGNLKKFGRKDIAKYTGLVNVNNAVMNSVQLTKHRINELAVLELQLDDKVSPAKGHEMEIEQVIINLISNACDSIKERKNLLGNDYPGKITLKTYSRDKVYIVVEDNGSGIKDAMKGKIFDPYFTSKPIGVGTGLGLSISRNIIKKHEGNITFQSEEGKGSSFQIELVVAQTTA